MCLKIEVDIFFQWRRQSVWSIVRTMNSKWHDEITRNQFVMNDLQFYQLIVSCSLGGQYQPQILSPLWGLQRNEKFNNSWRMSILFM